MASAIKSGLSKAASKAQTGSELPSSEGGGVDPDDTSKYLLRITAGSSYDMSTHKPLNVNGTQALHISTPHMDAQVKVRIQDYNGLPFSSPKTCEYFSHPLHTSDRYSINYSFVPREDIRGEDLIFGFDFDRPIRDRLPPGFKSAMKIVTKFIDPGIYAEPYADKPYLYAPALGSWSEFKIGERSEQAAGKSEEQQNDNGIVVEEGAEGSGVEIRESLNIPSKADKRQKYFLDESNLSSFRFERGRGYHADFFNPYLDFANFAVKLPGISIGVAKYIDEKTHELRYVLKNRRTGDVYITVMFTLLFGDSLEEALEKEGPRQDGQSNQNAHRKGKVKQHEAVDKFKRVDEHGDHARPHDQEVQEPESRDQSSSANSDVSSTYKGVVEKQQGVVSTVTSWVGSVVPGAGSLVDKPSSSQTQTPEPVVNEQHRRIDTLANEDIEEFLRNKHSSAGR